MSKNNLKTKAISSFAWGLAERFSAKLVGMVVTVILARLLDPEHYSIISIISIFLSICDIFVEGGFSSALIQKKDADELDYSSVLFLSVGVAIIVYVVMFFSAPFIAEIYQEELLVATIRVLSLRLIIGAFYSVVCAYISKTMQFKKFFYATLVGTVISAIIGVWLAYHGYGVWALVAQQLVNRIIDTCILSFTSQLKLKLKFSWIRLKGLIGFGGKILLSTFISTVYSDIRPLIIGLKFQNTDLAYYSKGNMYPALFYNMLKQPLSSVLFPVMSKTQFDENAFLCIYRRFIKYQLF